MIAIESRDGFDRARTVRNGTECYAVTVGLYSQCTPRVLQTAAVQSESLVRSGRKLNFQQRSIR